MKDVQPLIFNIQKFSTHDGDGIRTTVFFKGCPLHCRWCHNPESQRFAPEMVVYADRCTACGACAAVWPAGACRSEGGKLFMDREKCTACGACADVCVQNARELSGKRVPVSTLVRELCKDRIFYEQSGGGVTLSGGEVMAQPGFSYVEDLCRRLHREGISVYIDTSGAGPYEAFHKILPYTDVFLYDIKVLDPEPFRRWIGADGGEVFTNLERLSKDGAVIDIRIPVIGGVNDTDLFFDSVIRFLRDRNIRVRRVCLLPYHDYGKTKYQNLGRTFENFTVPDAVRLQSFQAQLVQAGFADTVIGG